MVSVLIPVLNYNVTALVEKLVKQFQVLKLPYEIVIAEDGSTDFILENQQLTYLPNVKVFKLKENIGRSKIRNLLANKSKYEWLLFLDADVLPTTNNFVKNYIAEIEKNTNKVICGGLVYVKDEYKYNKNLRWKYGIKREEISSEKRQRQAHKITLGANFLLHKSVFARCKFNEELLQYGYEDILFLDDIIKNDFSVLHIPNSVYHLGLDDNIQYIKKTKQAIENLNYLIESKRFKGNNYRILKFYKFFQIIKIEKKVGNLYAKFSDLFENILAKHFINIYFLDFYKLTYLCYLQNKKVS